MTPPIRMVSVPVEDPLFYKLKDLIQEQSGGEWDDAMIVRDAHHFANCLRPMLTAAPVREEGGAVDDLVDRFAAALKEKLRAAEAKYGHNDAWMRDDWRDDLIYALCDHVAKGDPRDVAAYCSFAWHHGWSLALATREEAPAEAGEEWSSDDIETLISEALTDSFYVDWDADDGAKAVRHALEKEGLLLRAQPQAREEAQLVHCHHEAYQGYCAHCGVKIVNGFAVTPATPPAPEAEKLRVALKSIADATDAENPDSYRSDDREGCLDTVHAIAAEALAALQQEGR